MPVNLCIQAHLITEKYSFPVIRLGSEQVTASARRAAPLEEHTANPCSRSKYKTQGRLQAAAGHGKAQVIKKEFKASGR